MTIIHKIRLEPLAIICLSVVIISFLILPALTLSYGFSESSKEEILAAFGYRSRNISWLWFSLPCSLMFFRYFINDAFLRIRFDIYTHIIAVGIILISAKITNQGLGYASISLFIAQGLIISQGLAKLKVMQGDWFIVASLLAICCLIGIFIVYPTISIFVPMLYKDDVFYPFQAFEILSQSHVLRIVKNSLLVGSSVALTATILGLCFALYTTRVAVKTVILGRIFSILPIVTPPFVVGLGVTLMLGRSGYVTQWMVANFGLETINWLYGFTGIWLAQVLAFTPMAFMFLEGALKSIHPSIEEASYTLRGSPYQTFFQIILPLLRPALANAFLIVFVQSLADFSNPLVLGGSYDVLATQIYFYIAGSQLDYASASTLGVMLLVFSLCVFIIQYLWIGQRSFVTVSGKAYRGDVQSLPKSLIKIISVVFCAWALFNIMLYGSIFFGSFTVNWGVDYSLTLKHYAYLFGNGFSSGAWPSLISTLTFAAIAAPITAFFGVLIAYVVVRKNFKGKKTLEFLTLLCFAVPGTVAGISYLMAFNTAPIYLTSTAAIIVISMVMRNMPIGMRSAIAGLGQIDKSLDEASLSLRGNSFKTLLFVVLPLLRPALLSALVTSFVRSMTTVSAIVFLVTADTRVATAYILNRVEDGDYGIAIAYGSILIIVMMAIIFTFDALVGESRTSRSKAKKRN
ncbi:ferric transport system permease [Gammaproteobacteria bacterium]|nr:ferric transport system permease [Gammaproteobacteria bacterium]